MKYQSQQVALLYFRGALLIFSLQILFGLIGATIYVAPTLIPVGLLPFSVVRMIHTNALIIWLLMGFFGSTYFLLPEETEREIYSPLLAKVQFWIFLVAAVVAVLGYLVGNYDGRSYLEQPIYIKVGIVVVALMFLFNCSMTILRGRRTVISSILIMGLWGIAIFFLFGFYVPANVVIDKMFWWWVVHLWVEGVWELVMASILAFLLIKLTGIDREIVEKWLYVIVGLALFSGILGTGHHYYWIGLPGYWQWVGNIFSSIEPLPFFAMVLFSFGAVWKGGRDHPNKAALLWCLGCAVMAFFGGIHFWWPKITGRMYPEGWARFCAILTFIGFNLTFFPQFILGYLGMPRRYPEYPPEFQVWNVLSSAGSSLLVFGYVLPLAYLLWSLKYGAKAPANPWGAKGLEWQTESPPPTENFHTTPIVTEEAYAYRTESAHG